jgi:hypothetical protein
MTVPALRPKRSEALEYEAISVPFLLVARSARDVLMRSVERVARAGMVKLLDREGA